MTEPDTRQLAEELFERSRILIFRTGLFIQVVLLGVTAFFVRPVSDTFILRYNAFFGVDILGVWWQVYLIPAVCFLLFLGDIIMANILARHRSWLAALVLLYGSLTIVLSEVIAMTALITINF